MSKLELTIYEKYLLGGKIAENTNITAMSNIRCHYSLYINKDGSFDDIKLTSEIKNCLRVLTRYNLMYFDYEYRFRYPSNRTIQYLVSRVKKYIKKLSDGIIDTEEHVFCDCLVPMKLVLL